MSQELTNYILVAVLGIITVGLFVQTFKPTLVFGLSVLGLIFLGIMPLELLLTTLGNKSILTIFLLIFITTALRQHFNLLGLLDRFFRNIKSPRRFIFGMTGSVAVISSVVNNTPVVALMIPYVYNWARKRNFSPSRFLIPLAFAATLGGTITVIGTSTNLVLNGLLESNNLEPLGFGDFLVPGILVTIVGIAYLVLFGYRMLPERKDILEEFRSNRREYIVETHLQPNSKMVGKTVEEASLRNLKGVFLAELYRDGRVISPVSPREILKADDLLYFAGQVDQVIDLLKDENGLEMAGRDKFASTEALEVVEVLIPVTSDLAGHKVKDTNFRMRFDAAIVAVHRDGRRLGGRIGDVTLAYGDMLLLTTGRQFKDNVRGNKNLYTVSFIESIYGDKVREKYVFGGAALLGFTAMGLGWIDLFTFLLTMLVALSALGMFTVRDFRRDINPDLLVILVCAVAFGTTLIHSGTAAWMSEGVAQLLSGSNPVVALLAVMVTTVILTSFITNVAAVAVALPLIAAIISQMNVPGEPFYLAVAYGASAAFLTPVSYQTNLMVYGPGGYKTIDFFRVGLPLTVLYVGVVITYLVIRYQMI